ncbi:VOC family protein [Paenibacillus sp.]|uniref:VOC family protein n=1 Tax=Paenibacillus sp. TaxID=58172 RepID=UPI002835D260|nr:VOC family protein [Paenibacillus sp.]MDR0268664.1 VOC family protein [Paenibacillus sp.]
MRIHHVALEVIKLEEAVSFYKNVLGFREEYRLNVSDENIVFLLQGDFRIELIGNEYSKHIHDRIHFCFEIECLQEIMKMLEKNGCKLLEGPLSLSNGWDTVFYRGPHGEVLEFLETS